MNAQQLRNSILQQAIQGKLVPQDPNDEPASVLLQRIRKEKERLVKEGKLKKKDLESKPIEEDEIPFEIPESWEWVRLGEISTYSHTKKKINASKADPHIWGLDLEDIEKGGRLLCIKTVEERKAIGDKTYFNSGDILYSKLRPYLLKILVAPKDGICTPEIIPFTCYGNISGNYIVDVLKSAYVDDYINSVTFGVKMPRVSTETMTSLLIPLPPLAEQRRIVAKIEELMPLVERYGKAQQALDQLNESLPARLRQSILQEAIQGRLVPQDPKEEPASELLKRIRKEKEQLVKEGKLKKKDLESKPIKEDEIPFEIPESWEWVRLNYISKTITKGTTPRGGNVAYSSTGIGFLRAENVGGFDELDLSRLKFVTEDEHQGFLSRSIIEADDILITIAGTLGRTALVKEKHLPLNANQAVSIVRLVNSKLLSLKYLIYSLNEPSIQKVLTKQKKVTAIPNLTLEIISDCIIPLPPLSEQKRIVAKVEELFGVMKV